MKTSTRKFRSKSWLLKILERIRGPDSASGYLVINLVNSWIIALKSSFCHTSSTEVGRVSFFAWLCQNTFLTNGTVTDVMRAMISHFLC